MNCYLQPLNIVNFRFVNQNIDNELLNDFNAELLMRLHESGDHTPSSALLNNIFSIRVAPNHRSRLQDFKELVEDVIKIGNKLLDENK